ncbi:MAG: ABC transporter ATP-binding protein [Desulfobacteraceae bacterium]|nr:ABC transporter ATP-binding protein [Desulfobacteraceae bacterium]
MKTELLRVENITKHFSLGRGKGVVRAVDDVSFTMHHGETIGVVGESGCGKSTLARVILRLITATSGKVWLDGVDLAGLTPKSLRIRRQQMQMIFQDAYASLDSRQKIGRIIAEPLVVHGIGNKADRRRRVNELLEMVGLERDAASRYPHEFSGGQRQRIGIARAIALEPDLVIADEPVSALDVSIQSQVLNLLVRLREKLSLSYIFISHDLAVVEHLCTRIIVMYLGQIVETTDTDRLFQHPSHPYTKALLSAIPRPDVNRRGQARTILKGDIPNPENPPAGCRFHTRCPSVMPICKTTIPTRINLNGLDAPHLVSCHLYP